MATKPDDFDQKGISVARLREFLAELPDDALLSPNQVGNIAVFTPDWEYIGYIDVRFERSDVEYLPLT